MIFGPDYPLILSMEQNQHQPGRFKHRLICGTYTTSTAINTFLWILSSSINHTAIGQLNIQWWFQHIKIGIIEIQIVKLDHPFQVKLKFNSSLQIRLKIKITTWKPPLTEVQSPFFKMYLTWSPGQRPNGPYALVRSMSNTNWKQCLYSTFVPITFECILPTYHTYMICILSLIRCISYVYQKNQWYDYWSTLWDGKSNTSLNIVLMIWSISTCSSNQLK